MKREPDGSANSSGANSALGHRASVDARTDGTLGVLDCMLGLIACTVAAAGIAVVVHAFTPLGSAPLETMINTFFSMTAIGLVIGFVGWLAISSKSRRKRWRVGQGLCGTCG